jgi:tripartite-type tricarboxylate transporter receptor subunit TctC
VVATTDSALYAPTGTPSGVIARLHHETAAVLEMADLRAKLATQAIEVRGGTPEALKAELAGEMEKWGRVIRAANIRVE